VDNEAMEAFDLAAVSYQLVLTKADKLRSQRDVDQVTAETQRKIAKRPAAFPRVLATSAEKGVGIPELRAEILAACAA
jgi:GTP-binding protein